MRRRGFFGSLLGLLGVPAKGEERIRVDLGALRPIPCVELDPNKKYLFVADPSRFDAKTLAEIDLGIDGIVIFDHNPPGERDFVPCRYCNGTLPEAGEMQHDPDCPWNLGKLAAVKAMEQG